MCIRASSLVGRPLVETVGPIRTYAIAMIIGGLALVPFADLEWPTREVAGLLAVLALASTLLAYLLLGVGLTRISATRASVIATAGPVVATCLLYTFHAAEERTRVDLGGRRNHKKKKTYDYRPLSQRYVLQK